MALRSDRVDTLIQGNFPPDGAPSLLSAFSDADASRTTALPKQSFKEELAEYGASIEAIYGQETTLQDLRDLSVKFAKMEQEDEYRNALAGVLSGRNIEAFLQFLNKNIQKIQTRDRKARAEAHYMALLHAQLAQLDDLIEWHGDEIVRLEQEVSELDALGERIRNGELDPNDPADAALMAKYGITPDDLKNGGKTALKKIEDGIDNRQKQIDWHKDQRGKVIDKRDDLADEIATDIAERKARGEVIDPSDTKHPLVEKRLEQMGLRLEAQHHEMAILTLEELLQHEGQPDYIEKIDAFINDSSERTLNSLFSDVNLSNEIRVRIELKFLKEQLAELDEIKDEPYYAEEVNAVLSEATESARNALRNEPDLSEEVVAYFLYQSDSEEQSAKSDSARLPENGNSAPDQQSQASLVASAVQSPGAS